MGTSGGRRQKLPGRGAKCRWRVLRCLCCGIRPRLGAAVTPRSKFETAKPCCAFTGGRALHSLGQRWADDDRRIQDEALPRPRCTDYNFQVRNSGPEFDRNLGRGRGAQCCDLPERNVAARRRHRGNHRRGRGGRIWRRDTQATCTACNCRHRCRRSSHQRRRRHWVAFAFEPHRRRAIRIRRRLVGDFCGSVSSPRCLQLRLDPPALHQQSSPLAAATTSAADTRARGKFGDGTR
mmetsp:Transcript_38815/g.77343  ORF Transcript_38815/g.77343 Transcript_38815/m.77343 type:complete len:236 (-) Transcript_38815:144-851(-)